MTVTIVICVILTWQGECLRPMRISKDFPGWSSSPCEDFVPPKMRHVLLSCEKDAYA